MPLPANDTSAPIAHKAAGADPYAWLQERDTDAVLDYLKAENSYQERQLAQQAPLREVLFQEIKDESSRPTCRCPRPGAPICITPGPLPATSTPGITAAHARRTTA